MKPVHPWNACEGLCCLRLAHASDTWRRTLSGLLRQSLTQTQAGIQPEMKPEARGHRAHGNPVTGKRKKTSVCACLRANAD